MLEEAGPRTDEGAVRHAEEGVEERAARARVPGRQGGHAGPEIGRVGPGGGAFREPRAVLGRSALCCWHRFGHGRDRVIEDDPHQSNAVGACADLDAIIG